MENKNNQPAIVAILAILLTLIIIGTLVTAILVRSYVKDLNYQITEIKKENKTLKKSVSILKEKASEEKEKDESKKSEEKKSKDDEKKDEKITKNFGSIKKAYTQNNKNYITIDYEQLLNGDEAIKAAKEDGEIPADQDFIENDYYRRNQNPKLRTFEADNNATIKILTESGNINSKKTVSFSNFKDSIEDFEGYYITLKGDKVIKIDQQFFP